MDYVWAIVNGKALSWKDQPPIPDEVDEYFVQHKDAFNAVAKSKGLSTEGGGHFDPFGEEKTTNLYTFVYLN